MQQVSDHEKPNIYSDTSAWSGLVADLSIQYGDLVLEAVATDKTPEIDGNGQWIEVVGASPSGQFSLYLPAKVCMKILHAAAPDLVIEEMTSESAAMIFEHITTARLEQLEEVLGTDLTLARIQDVVQRVTAPVKGLDLDVDGETHPAAIRVEGKLTEWLEIVVNRYSNPQERALNPRMIVHLGPIIMPSRQAYLVGSDELVDCGVAPSDVIKGILMREDKRYWPVFIEDNTVEISGPLSGPVDFQDEGSEQVYITLGLGEVYLDALSRVKLETGSRLEVSRLPGNSVNIYYQARPFGQGQLTVLEENLAVKFERIGSFVE